MALQESVVIRKLPSGECRLYSRKKVTAAPRAAAPTIMAERRVLDECAGIS